DRLDDLRLAESARAGRRDRRRRQLPLDRLEAALPALQGQGRRVRRRRNVGRGVGAAERLLPDGRRRRRRGGEGRAGVHNARARRRLRARRPQRRGTLLQDGPQRDRVRDARRVRLGGALVAPGAARARAQRRPRPREDPRLGRRLGRRPLDGAGRDRRGRAGARHHALAALALRLAAGRVVQREGDRGAAQPVRRSRRESRRAGRRGGRRRALVTATRTQTSDGVAVNPLRRGLSTNRIPDPCNIVFFGASGDLMKRMLMPAMWNLRLDDILPSNFGIVGFSRSEFSDDEFRGAMRKSVDEFSRSGPAKEPLWSDFAQHLSYISGDFDDVNCFHKLREHLEKNDKELGTGGNRLFYLSTPPSVFSSIIEQLDKAGLGPRDNKAGWSRIIIEKPFGTDLDSARALQAEVEKVFPEKQVYRIDHYLGKEPVQDIMALRFANVIFEPVWNRRYVDSVQITAAETVGVEGRGGYYDNAGALRDMIQNHVMNLVALVAMDPPVSSDADSIRDEKFKVLRAIRPIEPGRVILDSARGQYDAGSINGKPVPAYREEPDVRPDSNTETYAAVKLWIDNWRWADVPFYMRSGKRLA